MQLAVPKLRSASGLLKFNSAFKEAAYDLGTWRDRANLPAKETAILDAEDAAGWDLAEALLRPRAIDINEESGRVKFVNTNGQAARLGVSLALNHRFIQLVRPRCRDVGVCLHGHGHCASVSIFPDLSGGNPHQDMITWA